MTTAFQRLYNATPFDPNDRGDRIGEEARQLILTGAHRVAGEVLTGEDLPYLLGGLLVGTVQIMQAMSSTAGGHTRDEIDALIRSSIIQTAAWAVDMARATEGQDPLPNA